MTLSKQRLFDHRKFNGELVLSADPLPLFKSALSAARQRLKEFHLAGESARDIVSYHAWLIDTMLIHAWEYFGSRLSARGQYALVAVGGYGRGELHPYSDVDLMILMDKDRLQVSGPVLESLVRFVWDMGLEVGHSVRTIKDCVREAKNDITVITNLMEARYLAGNEDLFTTMQRRIDSSRIWSASAFHEAKLTEQKSRHLRFDNTAYNLEPNVKEGPGGLRDVQTSLWILQRRYGITRHEDLITLKLLTTSEHRTLIKGRNFLWRLRNGLHFLTGRREDRLLFDHQRSLAAEQGYLDNEHSLAIEQLMKKYYRTVKELSWLNQLLLLQYSELNSKSKVKTVTINRRFNSVNGFLDVKNKKIFQQYPYALLEVFFLQQQNQQLLGISANTIRLIRQNLNLIDSRFRQNIQCRSLFMEILRQPFRLTHMLRQMNQYEVLGAYIPDFGQIVGQMQHDLFHVYTVDAHTLFVVRNLRRLTVPSYQGEFPLASKLITKIKKPERLYLAGLFHDIAKGRGGDHSVLGEQAAYDFCIRHDLSEYDSKLVAWLVRRHLVMSWTTQHKDISDPDVVLEFINTVGDQEHLDNIYLLTMADMRATSPKIWNSWKARLLEDLYFATTRALRIGTGKPIQIAARIADIKTNVLTRLKLKQANPNIEQFWRSLPGDYFLRHEPQQLAWHIQTLTNGNALDFPIVACHYNESYETFVFFVFAPYAESLLSQITGVFESLDLNIVDARLHKSKTGFALYSFIALPEFDETISTTTKADITSLFIEPYITTLRKQLLTNEPIKPKRSSHLSRAHKHFRIEPKIEFPSSQSDVHTTLVVTAQDQPGLLHKVSICFQQCKVRLVNAKIATYGERVEDVFFITGRDDRPVVDPIILDCLTNKIFNALNLSPPND